MNNSTIYDRRLFKESFKDIYNDKDNKFNFPLNNKFFIKYHYKMEAEQLSI